MVSTYIGEPDVLAKRLQGEIATLATDAAAAGRALTVVVSGGSVATTFFPGWAARRTFEWAATEVFWADERAVPPTDPDSNYALAASLWLGPTGAPAPHIHRMPADQPDLARAARAYGDLVGNRVGRPPVFDLVLLGIGPDGHVGSLFPGHAILAETAAIAAAVFDSPKPPPRRMTLTVPVLAGARCVVLGAFGPSKAAIVREAIEDAASRLPAAQVARAARRALWLLDPSAASQLTRG